MTSDQKLDKDLMKLNSSLIAYDQKPDKQFSKLSQDFIIREPKLKCPQQYDAVRVCTNPECSYSALFCNSLQCQTCSSNHQNCYNVLLSAFTRKIKDRSQSQKGFIHNIFQAEKEIIELIKKNQRMIFQKYSLGDLEQNFVNTLRQIYSSKGQQEISIKGKEANELYNRLKKNNSDRQVAEAQLLETYKKQSKKTIEQLLCLKQDIFQSFLIHQKQDKQPKFELQSKILYSKPLLKFNQILTSQNQKIQFLRLALNNPKRLQLIFRASEKGFSAAEFHRYCDSIPNTLTLIQTEFGKVIGGYTPNPWKSDGSNSADSTNNTFLLSLNLRQKMPNNNSTYATHNNASYGPCFGNASDLLISDKCNENNNSKSSFPTYFNLNGLYNCKQESYTAFTGTLNGNNFKVLQYEVFKVIG